MGFLDCFKCRIIKISKKVESKTVSSFTWFPCSNKEKKKRMSFRKLSGWMCLCFLISTVEPVDKTYIFVLWVKTLHSLVGTFGCFRKPCTSVLRSYPKK
jgi:hypothetical protein